MLNYNEGGMGVIYLFGGTVIYFGFMHRSGRRPDAVKRSCLAQRFKLRRQNSQKVLHDDRKLIGFAQKRRYTVS